MNGAGGRPVRERSGTRPERPAEGRHGAAFAAMRRGKRAETGRDYSTEALNAPKSAIIRPKSRQNSVQAAQNPVQSTPNGALLAATGAVCDRTGRPSAPRSGAFAHMRTASRAEDRPRSGAFAHVRTASRAENRPRRLVKILFRGGTIREGHSKNWNKKKTPGLWPGVPLKPNARTGTMRNGKSYGVYPSLSGGFRSCFRFCGFGFGIHQIATQNGTAYRNAAAR